MYRDRKNGFSGLSEIPTIQKAINNFQLYSKYEKLSPTSNFHIEYRLFYLSVYKSTMETCSLLYIHNKMYHSDKI